MSLGSENESGLSFRIAIEVFVHVFGPITRSVKLERPCDVKPTLCSRFDTRPILQDHYENPSVWLKVQRIFRTEDLAIVRCIESCAHRIGTLVEVAG